MTMYRQMKFSGGVIHRLLMRELHHESPTDEMWILLRNYSIRFLKIEFYMFTGLHLGVLPDTTRYEAMENSIHQRYFGGIDGLSFEELRVVLTLGELQEAYDVVKLCLIYILNWILIGLDERFKIPVWQFQLVEDLNVFDVFPWGAYVYRHSICSFKHALYRRRTTFERCQHAEGTDEHTVETYNIYILSHALLWDRRFHLEGRGRSPSETEASDPEGAGLRAMDSEGSELDPRRVRHRRVWFATPEPVTSRGDSYTVVR
ncbi:hypothetical protein Ddye_016895 [Dipteronia dyeriana]|uniref:DUF1985 domain-containing protein n=1 Tax=Dipteronia dyeriana TaxID=168575 RepID=A0AAD9U7L3_9ROSI|nr:hypothetical protein Ddye_016895 [Dipteronia dyeriana]